MRLAHVRERNAPAGTPWRLAAALDPAATSWLDIEIARRRAVGARPGLAHDSTLHRQPVTTLDDHLARGLRVEALADLVEAFAPREDDDDAILDADDLEFGPPVLRPPSFRDFYAFERHVATTWARRGQEIPEAWFRLPVFYFSNVSELRGPGEAVWAPRGSDELDYELEIGVLVDTPVLDVSPDRAEEAIGGLFILNDWSARDLQRDETTVRLGPAKGKDFALSAGPWLVTPDELADRRPPGSTAPDLTMTATVRTVDGRVVETSRGTLASIHHGFGEMIARASADVHLRPGEILGSGTVGGGCLLEIRDETLGRYLEPGDEVTLEVERLGRLVSPVIARPPRP
ncbi:MAG TPA: fumarylacetoacetate hydrolase family protein [Candidatus Limnocylindrales bacterium]|jgi:fumarylacetoacetate (FAA) hydrolase|nr:fumarylacetoacetate hydrolase family protein [Candidatus Limnocylindrales bacterium]